MSCKSCGSANVGEYGGEIAIHFPGLKNVDRRVVWVFPQIAVCLQCGMAEFVVPEGELGLLQKRDTSAGETT